MDFRFLNFSCLMLDAFAVAARLSCSQQANDVTLFNMIDNVCIALRSLSVLQTGPGKNEAEFLSDCAKDGGADIYRGAAVTDGEKGRVTCRGDRAVVLQSLKDHLTTRFKDVLDQPEIQAYSIFDHRKWPSLKPAPLLAAFGIPEVTLLCDLSKEFFEDTSVEVVLQQWEALKIEISSSPGLFGLKFVDLWPRMIEKFGDKYQFVLRLVAFMLLMPIDTSICERMFSLMNNIKSSERSALEQATLCNLMLWHHLGRDVSLADLPWISILKEFHMLTPTGTQRKKHRAFVNLTVEHTTAESPAAPPPAAPPSQASAAAEPGRPYAQGPPVHHV